MLRILYKSLQTEHSQQTEYILCDALSEFMSSSIPSWQILTAHAQPLAFCLKVPLDSLLVWASSGGSGETARMRRLAWTFAARTGDKYQISLMRPISFWATSQENLSSGFPPGETQTGLLSYRD